MNDVLIKVDEKTRAIFKQMAEKDGRTLKGFLKVLAEELLKSRR